MKRTGPVCIVFTILLIIVIPAGSGYALPVPSMDDRGSAVADDGAVLVVDDDGSAEYASIQVAVDDAQSGDTVTVRPGTYREQITIGKNISLVAPNGATLDGSQFDRPSGIRIQEGVIPVIDGFNILNYAYGVDADRSAKFGVTESHWDVGWTVRNTTIRGSSEAAIRAGSSKVDWTVEDVRIDGEGGYVGIAAPGSYGDWTVRNTVITDVEFDGLDIQGSRGDWTIRNTSIADAGDGIDAGFSGGVGRITDSTVRDVETGVTLSDQSGSVVITNTIIEHVSHPPEDPAYNGVAVYAANSSGDWSIRESIISGYTRIGINATDSAPSGDARRNWWGKGPRGENSCIGNVRCGTKLSDRPTVGATLDSPGAPGEGGASGTPRESRNYTQEHGNDTSVSPFASNGTRNSESSTTAAHVSVDPDRTRANEGGLSLHLVNGSLGLGAMITGGILGWLFNRIRK